MLVVSLQSVHGVHSAVAAVTATKTKAAAPVPTTAISTATLGARPVTAPSAAAPKAASRARDATTHADAGRFTSSAHKIDVCNGDWCSHTKLTATISESANDSTRLPFRPRKWRGRREFP